ncbi:tripartite tricarboxylate transporter TctB family protein [Paracoccus sediminis]|uniref:Tripartite tricarboxylate transporter TctB family protein n=1 Tax=Paracoccus sediminis TaxID=1214787 RepID=A0A238WKJ7_9RHOB|nr:tripartite tricarboxylate transporter TctB family protein [Paracoccus sediminis]TBN50517.1 tripartite tricarboxylate transporter TctB family protein [Paracoccus sediminis]SNR47092.1 Tripartite tricarboxylate transporter TctB family protein [Paracoccus sediminis]
MTVKVFHAELGTAVTTGLLGLAGMIGASELGHGWTESGPQPGYFPFYVGLILIGASLWNLVAAFLKHRAAHRHAASGGEVEEPFLDRERARRLGVFIAALLAFVVATLTLGIYAGSILYIAWSAWRQGGYRLPLALGVGVAFAVSLYLIFEVIFKIPLLKGPIEPLLGIY